MRKNAPLAWLLSLTASVGTAQTLISTFQFSASGYLGTPATATTPFQGQTFTNAAITITAIGSLANLQPMTNAYCLPSDSATVSVSGLGTFEVTASGIGIMNSVEVDPIKGVLGNSIEFYASTLPCYPFGIVATTVLPGSTAWNMLSSFGPFQTTINIGFQMPTNGGTLQLNGNALGTYTSPGVFQATFTGTPPPPLLTRVGVLSHVAAGGTIGSWATVITLVNNSSSPRPVTVALHNEDGSAMTLPLTVTQGGASQSETTSSANATINPHATLLISMGSGMASTTVGWADVLSSGPLGGFAIFRQTPPTGSPSEGTVPLQTQFPSAVTLPYDNTAGFSMGVALANLSTTAANVAATIWDGDGNQIGVQNITIAGSGHTSFVLPTEIPATAGTIGIVQFQSHGGLAALELRFSPFGTFTSVPTI